MSTPKKKPEDVAANDAVEVAEEKVEPVLEEKKESPSVSMDDIKAMIASAVKDAVAATKAENEAQIAALKEELEEAKAKAAAPHAANPYGDVTLVYLSDSPGIIDKVPGISLACNYFGEEFTVSRQQFDSIVGRYRKWFDMGILAVSRDNIDVAAKKGLKTQDEYTLKASLLERLGTMPVEELKKLWKNCKNDNERLCIVTFYKRKFIEGKEPGYHETERVLALNALTQQGLKREALEISGASLKISPTDFLS